MSTQNEMHLPTEHINIHIAFLKSFYKINFFRLFYESKFVTKIIANCDNKNKFCTPFKALKN